MIKEIDKEKVKIWLNTKVDQQKLSIFPSNNGTFKDWLKDWMYEIFDAKRPNANSGWYSDVAISLHEIGFENACKFDSEGYVEDENYDLVEAVIKKAIELIFIKDQGKQCPRCGSKKLKEVENAFSMDNEPLWLVQCQNCLVYLQ